MQRSSVQERPSGTGGAPGRRSPRSHRAWWVAAAGLPALALLAASPAVLNLYWMRVVTYALMFASLTQALNLIAGYAGYPAFGNVVFLGLGAYSVGVMMKRLGAPFPLAVLIAVLVCGVVSLAAGPPLLRLRGHYFAIGTLALNEATRAVVENLTPITGGGKGLSLPIAGGSAQAAATFFFYLFLAAMLFCLLVVFLITRSRLGYALRAIRAREEAAEALGVRATRAKVAAWAVSGMLTGLVGGIYAYWIAYIDPPSVFSMGTAVEMFVILLLGGAGTLFGPILGAFFIEYVATTTWSNFLTFHTGIFGAIVILVVLFLPGGFVPFLRDGTEQIRRWAGRR